MSVEHKYIRHSTHGFVIWPVADGELWHKHVAERLKKSKDEKIISAGYCRIHARGAECYSESETLGIKSLPEDSALLSKQLGLKP